MSCFNNRSSSDIFSRCCDGSQLCEFNGNLDDVISVPVYLQYIYDAVQFNLQGMKNIQNQTFTPAIPCGFTISRICDIRTRSFFNPANIDDPRNLTVDMDTTLSGASFLQDCHGHPVEVVGPDGTHSQKILYADNCGCSNESGVPVFGTQNVSISGNIMVYIDLILCDNCNHETKFTVCAEVPVATRAKPMTLTNFFEICIPSNTDAAFLPRFTELTCCGSEARLATNNCGCDLNITSDGELCVNLIVALCVTAEKKVVAPVQMCVLSTGLADVPSQTNTVCSGFPSMFAGNFGGRDSDEDNDCGCFTSYHNHGIGCGCGNDHRYGHNSGCGCNPPHRHDDCGCDRPPHNGHHDDCGCNHSHYHDDCGCEPDPCDDGCGCNDRPEPRGCR